MLTPNNESSVTMKIKNGGIISIVINGRNNTGVSTYTKKAANFITTLNKETYEQRINISPNANPVKLVFIDEDTLATNNNNQTTFSFESWAAFNRAIGNDLNLPANAVLNAKITYFAAKYTTTKILVTDLSTEFSPE
jgi:hypothetical protein